MEDPLSEQLSSQNKANATQNNQSALLNELDDLQHNVIVSASSAAATHSHHRPHSQTQSSIYEHKSGVATRPHHMHRKSTKKKTARTRSLMNGDGQQIVDQLPPLHSDNDQSDDDDDGDTNNEGMPETETDANAYSWRPTVLCGLFENEYAGAHGRLHNEAAMLKCDALYVVSEDSVLVDGELCLTNFLLYFVPRNANAIAGGMKHVMLPIACIARIDTSVRNNMTEIVLTDRIYRCLKFRFQSDKQVNYISADKVLQMLRAVCFPKRMIDLFAFEYCKNHPCHPHMHDGGGDIWGWDVYDAEKEFHRMGIRVDNVLNASSSSLPDASNQHETTTTTRTAADDNSIGQQHSPLRTTTRTAAQSTFTMQRRQEHTATLMPSGNGDFPRYRFTWVNRGFAICASYPEVLVVPSSITDWELQQVARFRRLGRIPVLTWRRANSNVALFRCSQPQVGMASNRSRADEHLIQSIGEANVGSSVLYIMDARPKLNARVNKMKGAGFENANFYKNIRLEFLNIHNIHFMRRSRKALSALVHSAPGKKDKEWYQLLASTEWMSHIRELLKGAFSMVRVLTKQQQSVLCHCSDGWDRTSQLCCLTQVCLDAYYRSMRGFIVLICKDWLSFGHQFEKRCGHRKDDAVEEDERSPVFEQFIECVYQLLQQYPLCFEFNQEFLICILDHVYSCKYGTFLCDTLKQRRHYKLGQRTLSLWTHLQNSTHSKQFVNLYHRPNQQILMPKYSLKILNFWNAWHLRSCVEHITKQPPMYVDDGALQIQRLFTELKQENQQMKQQIAELKTKNRKKKANLYAQQNIDDLLD